MSEYIIETKRLSCQYGHNYLLKDINWQVKQREHWCIFGLNGCGKTTLLSIIAGYKMQTSGIVTVFGEEYTNENSLELRKRIGLVSSSLFDKYYHDESALNIVLSGKTGTLGLDFSVTEKDVKKAKTLLKSLNLKDKVYRPYSTMSKGERQSVLIARALINEPEIIILDEPCSGLDVVARNKLLLGVEHMAAQLDTTIIYVTHYLEEVLPVFQKTLLLRNGKMYDAVKTEKVFIETFMNDFLNGQ